MKKLDNILTIIIIICNFIIAIMNYFQGMSLHDAYYMSLGTFHLMIGFGLMFLKKD